MALLELTSSDLRVEVRGGAELGTEALQVLLTPLVGAVERVLGEYPGFVCDRKQI